MKYFEYLPTIQYDISDANFTAKVKNIFYKLELYNINKKYFKFYNVIGEKRLDQISFELYGTTDFWWLIAILNNIRDIIFDVPLSSEMIQSIARNKTLEIYNSLDDEGAMVYYIEKTDELELENDSKRKLVIINQSYVGEVVTELLKMLK